MYVSDRAAKVEALSRFRPHYNGVDVEGSKHVQIESGLPSKIKQLVGIKRFSISRCWSISARFLTKLIEQDLITIRV